MHPHTCEIDMETVVGKVENDAGKAATEIDIATVFEISVEIQIKIWFLRLLFLSFFLDY